jgi:hypothetical protein
MPQAFVAKLAKEHNISTSAAETKWKAAKNQAAQQDKGENYAYVTTIFKSMMHESVFTGGFKDFLKLTERQDDESYDRGERGDRFEFGSDEEFGDGQDNPFDDEDQDDEFSDEDQDDEFSDEDQDDEFDDHEGHQLSDIVGPDELDDQDSEEDFGHPNSDEDFDDEDQDDEFSDDELDSELDYEGDDDREGNPDDELTLNFGSRHESLEDTASLSFLGELMNLTEKKKPLKKAAKAVYHRDYERTSKKPYRKYHPETEYVKDNR